MVNIAQDSKFDQDEQGNIITEGKSWKQFIWSWKGLWLIAAIAIMVIGYGRFGFFALDKALTIGFFMLLTLILQTLYMAWLKYKSPTGSWIGGHASICGDFIHDVGGYHVVPLGGIDCQGWYKEKGSEGTLICPSTAAVNKGRNQIFNVRVVNTPEEELPPMVLQFVAQENMPPPYKVGYVDEDQLSKILSQKDLNEISKEDPNLLKELFAGTSRPQVETLVHKTIELNREVNMLKDMLKRNSDIAEQYVKQGIRMSQPRQPSFADRLLGDNPQSR